MVPTGDLPSEGARIAHNEKVTEKIEYRKRVNLTDNVTPEKEAENFKEMGNLRRERFANSNTEERIGYINQVLPLLKDWHEVEGTTVELDRIFEEWGFVPTPESLSPELKEEIEKIKKENDWLVEESRG